MKPVIARYYAAFRAGDHEAVLELLTEDVVWELPGHKHVEGRAGFAAAMGQTPPELHVDRFVAEEATVVAVGWGERFTFADVFTLRGRLIERIESYVVPLGGG